MKHLVCMSKELYDKSLAVHDAVAPDSKLARSIIKPSGIVWIVLQPRAYRVLCLLNKEMKRQMFTEAIQSGLAKHSH